MKEGTGEPHWVLDTNVIVSGMLSPSGPPGRLLDMVQLRRMTLVLDDRILAEYRSVLERPKFAIGAERLQAFFGIMRYQRSVVAAPVAGLTAMEAADTVFLEVAAASCQVLVTGNLRHFPQATRGDIEVISPAEAWHRGGWG